MVLLVLTHSQICLLGVGRDGQVLDSFSNKWVWVKISHHQELDRRFKCPWFHLPGQPIFGYLFLTHSHLWTPNNCRSNASMIPWISFPQSIQTSANFPCGMPTEHVLSFTNWNSQAREPGDTICPDRAGSVQLTDLGLVQLPGVDLGVAWKQMFKCVCVSENSPPGGFLLVSLQN